ncbi:hypothetical protein RB195_000852 [Necator americanus]|uniref:Reverse transcriptase domain-containing protein n=1 Tax=Necator americanus TaxID=51031 RepID=A0ABR1DBQ9_NECAM
MRKLEWDDMGVKVGGRQLHHLRFADDVVLITPSIRQAERMLTEEIEEDKVHLTPWSPLQHHRTSCFDLCFGNLGISQA